jgi:hypothetical protein
MTAKTTGLGGSFDNQRDLQHQLLNLSPLSTVSKSKTATKSSSVLEEID